MFGKNIKFHMAHWWLHITTYVIPRSLRLVFLKMPRALLKWIIPIRIGKKNGAVPAPATESTITVVRNAEDLSTTDRFGLTDAMTYDAPLYPAVVNTILGLARPDTRNNYERLIVDGADGNPICVDWLKPPEGITAARGLIALIPGLGSYSQTNYIQSMTRHAAASGFHCFVVNCRGMGNAPLTRPQLTSVTFTSDLHVVMQSCCSPAAIRKRFGADIPVFAVGFSAGGATLIKYLGEVGKGIGTAHPSPIAAAIVFCAPYDMHKASDAMRTPLGRLLYQPSMMTALKKYAIKHEAIFRGGIPGLQNAPAEMKDNPAKYICKRFTEVRDFDRRVVAPHFGYDDEQGYYTDGSSTTWLPHVQAPIICVAAKDDPITGNSPRVAYWRGLVAGKPNIAFVQTPAGGHLGFLGGPADTRAGRPHYMETFAITRFLRFLGDRRLVGHATTIPPPRPASPPPLL